ncbi:MAG: hypothetical protein ABT20_16315 [Rubrivivax sp. SCN 70-15]|jgi:hypothetical protein|nr:MAG: hypothetical protein ABT20_16315 [Rubrivivax sp. SCN 70-15]
MTRASSLAMTIGWPSFLMAAVLEVLVFSLVDPTQLHWFGGAALELSATAVYSLAFFVFWIVIAVASFLTHRLGESAVEVNSRTFR